MSDFATLKEMGIDKIFDYRNVFVTCCAKYYLPKDVLEELIADTIIDCWLQNGVSSSKFSHSQFCTFVHLHLRHAINDAIGVQAAVCAESQLSLYSAWEYDSKCSGLTAESSFLSILSGNVGSDFGDAFFSLLHDIVDDMHLSDAKRNIYHNAINAVRYRFYDGMTLDQVAEKLGISVRQNASRFCRDSMRKVRGLLADNIDKFYSRFGFTAGDAIVGDITA